MTKLSVNINKFATLRNARGGNLPDILKVAQDCERFGAEGMAFARVLGELSLSVTLLFLMFKLELITLLPGAGRAIAMARVAWGVRGQAGAGKDE